MPSKNNSGVCIGAVHDTPLCKRVSVTMVCQKLLSRDCDNLGLKVEVLKDLDHGPFDPGSDYQVEC